MSDYKLCDICGKTLTENSVRIVIFDRFNGISMSSQDDRYGLDIEVHGNCAIDVKNHILDRGWAHYKKQFSINPELVPQYLKEKTSRLNMMEVTDD